MLQLQPTAADIAQRCGDTHLCVFRQRLPCLVNHAVTDAHFASQDHPLRLRTTLGQAARNQQFVEPDLPRPNRVLGWERFRIHDVILYGEMHNPKVRRAVTKGGLRPRLEAHEA